MNLFRFSESNLRFFLLPIIIFFGFFVSFAQNKVLIHGVIKNGLTQLPIEGANIQLEDTNIGTSTNRLGIFELWANEFPVILTISHISYHKKQIVTTRIQTDSIIVLLNPKSVILSETEITSGPYKIFKGKGQKVIDYEFIDTNIILLVYNYNNNHHELVLTDENLDTIATKDISYLKKPNKLFKDCMGNCHLMTKDSVYQIFSINQSMYLIYPTILSEFINLLGNCIFETPTYLVFEGNTDKKTKLEYAAIDPSDLPITRSKNEAWKHLFYFVNKKTHEKIILDNTYEWKKNRDAFENALFLFDDPYNKLFFGDLLRAEETMFFKPSFQTVKLIDDTIYYFNNLKSQIDIYTNDLLLLRSIKIEYHNSENWMPIIITDILKNKAYTIFTTGVLYSLAEINLHNGSIREVTTIKKIFPQRIKVNNGQLYFQYHDLNSIRDKKRLYQGELPNQ